MKESVKQMWEDFCKVNPSVKDEKYTSWHFCNTQELALKLANLVKIGRKKATSALFESYKVEGEELPKVAQYTVITDINGEALCIIRGKKVEVLKYKDFPAEYAMMEGEGDLSLNYWREVHEEFFREELREYKLGEFHKDIEIVYEEFECVYGGILSNTQVVKKFWDRFDKKDYRGTEILLDERFETNWVTTREKFDRENFIKVNEDYPGDWCTVAEKIENLDNNRVMSITHVFSPSSQGEFYATSIFTIKEGKIVYIEEYWAEVEEKPEWRKAYIK